MEVPGPEVSWKKSLDVRYEPDATTHEHAAKPEPVFRPYTARLPAERRGNILRPRIRRRCQATPGPSR